MANSVTATEKKVKTKNVHAGHRQRVKERFFREGLEGFEPHQVLEMLLFFGIPQKDTNELAHRLLDTFGSVYRVMEASYDDVRKVPGMTDNAAALVKFSCELARRYWTDRCEMGTVIYSSKDIGDYIKYHYIGEKVESVFVISMDSRGKVINSTRLSKGDVNYTDLSFRQVLEVAIRDNATQIAFVHNHPNGHAFPSERDIATTNDMARHLASAEIRLLDHIIVSEDDFVSLADTQMYAPIFTARYVSEEMRIQRKTRFLPSNEEGML